MRDPRTMLMDIDHSGLHSEPGSREWIITRRSLLVACLSDIKNNRATGQAVYEEIKQTGGWQHLTDLKGRPFRSFVQFCKNPNGLGLDRDEIERRLSERYQALDDKDREGQRGPGRPAETLYNENSAIQGLAPTGTSSEAALRRLRKHRPDIHARVMAGKLTAHAGMVEAGFRKPGKSRRMPTLDKILKLVPMLTNYERVQLIQHLGGGDDMAFWEASAEAELEAFYRGER
jgi:hypothetical protein